MGAQGSCGTCNSCRPPGSVHIKQVDVDGAGPANEEAREQGEQSPTSEGRSSISQTPERRRRASVTSLKDGGPIGMNRDSTSSPTGTKRMRRGSTSTMTISSMSGQRSLCGGFQVELGCGRGCVEDFYDLGAVLGQGSSGVVQKCSSKASGLTCAVKSMLKSASIVKKEEINLMKKLDHPNIIRLYETFEDATNYYLVVEYCSGGELFDKIVSVGNFSEQAGAMCAQQMLRAINYMHKCRIMHRDLKPENWLLAVDNDMDSILLKLADFGLATKFAVGHFASTKAGTPYYVAPEVLNGRYTSKADIWSTGVILYVMLCGSPPFRGTNTLEVLDAVKKAELKFTETEWRNMSPEAKNFLRSLLIKDQAKRPTAQVALSDPWVVNAHELVKVSRASLETMRTNLETFAGASRLKKAAIGAIALHLSDADVENLRDLFVFIDANHDGLLSHTEILNSFKTGGVQFPSNMRDILFALDPANKGNSMTYSEFLVAAMDPALYQTEDHCWTAFKLFDHKTQGHIYRDQMDALAQSVGTKEEDKKSVDDIFAEVDLNRDDKIDFGEFMGMMTRMPDSADTTDA